MITFIDNYFIFFVIILFFISLNIYNTNIKNYELHYHTKLLFELSTINSCCSNNVPIKCSRSLTFVNNNIKKRINSNSKKYYSFNRTSYFHSFIIRKANILIALHSHISLFYHRYVFRRIYKYYNDVQLLFFIGLDKNDTLNSMLYEEMKRYKDIILFDFYCDYYKLCMLTYNFLEWIIKYQHFYNVIIKHDTDTFLNIVLVKSTLRKLLRFNISFFVLGKIWHFDDEKRKYPSGMAYIFSSKSINQLMRNIDKNLHNLKCSFEEDMMFGFLSRKANFTFLDSYISFNYSSYTYIPKYKFNINNTFMIHALRIAEIAFLHMLIRNETYSFNMTCNLHN